MHVICSLAPLIQNPCYVYALNHVMWIPDTCCYIFVLLHTPLRVVAYNIPKVQNICCIASSLKIFWYGSVEWNMEENFSMEWKIFSMKWK